MRRKLCCGYFALGLAWRSRNANMKPLTACQHWNHEAFIHECWTKPLQMSRSTNQVMCSELVMWLLQPIMFSWGQNSYSSVFVSWGKINAVFIKAELSSNMYTCYHGTCNFAEWRRSRIWVFPWFAEGRGCGAKHLSRSGCGFKKMRFRPPLVSTWMETGNSEIEFVNVCNRLESG